MKRLAVCVDDYGLRPGVDDAVLALAAAGRISAFSCMAGSPRWPAAARRIGELRTLPIDVGLHLDFTEAPRDAGLRSSLGRFIARAYLGTLPRPRIAAEIRAQLDAFEDALGRAPDHVDGHQHVHQLPVVRELLLQELARRGHAHPWLRSTRVAPGEAGTKPRVIAALGDAVLRGLAARQGLRTNGHLLGVYGFDADAAGYLARLQRWLAVARDGDLLMCHPGLADAGTVADTIAAARSCEHAVLAGPAWPALLAQAGVQVTPLPARQAAVS